MPARKIKRRTGRFGAARKKLRTTPNSRRTPPSYRKKLTSQQMISITKEYYSKKIKSLVERGASRKEITIAMEGMRRYGESIIKRAFRTSPEERYFVKLLSQYREITYPQRAELMVEYLKKTRKTDTTEAKQEAEVLLANISKKAEKIYETSSRETVNYFHPKDKYFAGAEHMFSIVFLTSVAEQTIVNINQIK